MQWREHLSTFAQGDIVNCPHRVGGIGRHIQTAHLAKNAFTMSPSACLYSDSPCAAQEKRRSLMEFNRFDVSAKELVWDDPTAWLERFAIGPRGPVEVIDPDITTLTASADKVLRVGGPIPTSSISSPIPTMIPA